MTFFNYFCFKYLAILQHTDYQSSLMHLCWFIKPQRKLCHQEITIRGNVKKKKQYICWHCPNWGGPPSLLPYFWQIYFWQSVDHVDLPPSPRILDKNKKNLKVLKPKILWFMSKILGEGGRSTWSTTCQK